MIRPIIAVLTASAWAASGLAVATGLAGAQEQPVELAKGDGLETVEQNCGGCHSLDYIRMNSPFLSKDGWQAEVTKMRKALGAPISDADAATIVTYLAANYAMPTKP
jgi:mono/diheme cytochrome c family protein